MGLVNTNLSCNTEAARDSAILRRSCSPLRLASRGGVVLATTDLALGSSHHQLPQLLAH